MIYRPKSLFVSAFSNNITTAVEHPKPRSFPIAKRDGSHYQLPFSEAFSDYMKSLVEQQYGTTVGAFREGECSESVKMKPQRLSEFSDENSFGGNRIDFSNAQNICVSIEPAVLTKSFESFSEKSSSSNSRILHKGKRSKNFGKKSKKVGQRCQDVSNSTPRTRVISLKRKREKSGAVHVFSKRKIRHSGDISVPKKVPSEREVRIHKMQGDSVSSSHKSQEGVKAREILKPDEDTLDTDQGDFPSATDDGELMNAVAEYSQSPPSSGRDNFGSTTDEPSPEAPASHKEAKLEPAGKKNVHTGVLNKSKFIASLTRKEGKDGDFPSLSSNRKFDPKNRSRTKISWSAFFPIRKANSSQKDFKKVEKDNDPEWGAPLTGKAEFCEHQSPPPPLTNMPRRWATSPAIPCRSRTNGPTKENFKSAKGQKASIRYSKSKSLGITYERPRTNVSLRGARSPPLQCQRNRDKGRSRYRQHETAFPF